MNDAMKVKTALEGRAAALEAEVAKMREQDSKAWENPGPPSMMVYVKQQVAQEFRTLAGQIGIL